MLLRCTECARTVHSFCLNPPRVSGAVGGTWTCIVCDSAAATRKKQGVRTFRDAVRNYSYLVPSRYLDSLTESVELAAAAEAAIKSRLRDDQRIDFAVPAPAEAPQTCPDDNTVIIKVSTMDSDLDDIHAAKTSVQNLSHAVKRLSSEREAVEHENDDDPEGTPTDKRPPESSSKVSKKNDAGGPVEIAKRVRKKARLSSGPSPIADKARALNSTNLSPHVQVSESICNTKAAPLPLLHSLDSSSEFSSRMASRAGRRAKLRDANTKNRREVWVQLRCRPPSNERESLKGREASTEQYAGVDTMVDVVKKVSEVGQEGNDKERTRTKSKEKEKAQDKNKKRGKTQAEIEAENKAEICRRLAKARAKKAELRKAAMHRKEMSSKSMGGGVILEAKTGFIGPATPRKIVKGFLSDGGSAKHGPSPLSPSKVASSVKDLVPKGTDIATTARNVTLLREASLNNASGNGVSNTDDKRTAKNQPSVVNTIGVDIATETSTLKTVNGFQLSGHKDNPNTSGDYQAIPTNILATPDRRNLMEGTGTKEGPNADFTSGVDTERDIAFVYGETIAETDVHVKHGLSTAGEATNTARMRCKAEAVLSEPSSSVPNGRAHSPFSKVVAQDCKIGQRSVASAMVEEGTDKDKRKVIPIIELDQDSEEDTNGGLQLTFERRPVAKKATPYQSPAKGVVANVRSVPTEWGEMDLDAKNEALLTLAQEQKGRVKRRPSLVNASTSYDKDLLGRNVKSLGGADSIPNSERKRMQVTALVAQDRVRNTSASLSHDSNRTTARKGSIGRLLSDPSPDFSSEGHSIVVSGISQPRSASNLSNIQASVHDVDQPSLVVAATNTDNNTEVRRGMDRNSNYFAHIPDIHDARAAGIRLVDTTLEEIDVISRPVDQGQMLPRDNNVSSLHGDIPKLTARPVVNNASSRSGSQSEPGSAVAPGLTSVYTLKRTRKRPTLASVTKDPVLPSSEAGFDSTRSLSLISRGNDHVCTGYDRARVPPCDTNQLQQYSGGQISIRSGRDSALPSGSLPPRTSDGISDIPKAQTSAEYDGGNIRSPLRYQLYQHRSTKESQRTGGYDNLENADAVVQVGGIGDRLGRAKAPNSFGSSPAAGSSRLNKTSAQLYKETTMLSNGFSRNTSQKLHNNDHSFVDLPYRDNYSRQVVDDPMMFPEPSRRLKRSVAPTLPTAARRFQYEQGRQLARFTPSTSPSDYPQAYPKIRRRAATPWMSEQTLSAQNSSYDFYGDSHGELQIGPLQPDSTHHGMSRTRVLSHEYISQEGVRPQLVPVPPVVYEPEDDVRTRGLNIGSSEIPRLHDARRSYLQAQNSLHNNCKINLHLRGEINEQSLTRGQHLAPTLMGSGSHMEHSGLMDESSVQQPPLLTISRAKGDGAGARVAMETYRRSPPPLRRPSPTAFSPLSLSHLDQRDNEVDTTRYARNLQPARTDPSLKNLLD